MPSKQDMGIEGEEQAATALKKKGYKIIERNYRSPLGEIDIVAENDGYLVFVEVKRRNSRAFGNAVEAVDRKKKRHIIRCAMYYMKEQKCSNKRARFDVVGIDGDSIKIIKHAFMVDD